jgi:uncharacterized caspase-like protein
LLQLQEWLRAARRSNADRIDKAPAIGARNAGRCEMLGRLLKLAIALLLLSLTDAALAQSRVALVIGNAAYRSIPALKTPATDAAIVAETLRAAGYDVTELVDVHQADIGQAMRNFLDKLAAGGPGTVAFFYYSGHAARSNGENFLIPVDAVIGNENDISNEAFRLKELTEELVKLPLAARIIVLDASRDHAIGSPAGKPAPKGLATTQVLPGMLIAYAAAPGAVAVDADGYGDYSLYTSMLVTQMRQPGLNLGQILKNTRIEVGKTTDNMQTPWTRSALHSQVVLFEAPAQDEAQASPEEATEPKAKPPRRSHRLDGGAIIRNLLRHVPF